MNIILTENCNKGCSYCFAKGFHNKAQDPEFSDIRKIIDTIWEQVPSIKLIGGEPTIAKSFKETFDYIIYKNLKENSNKKIVIISNLLFSEDILNFIIEYLELGAKVKFLANATELDVLNRKEIFLKNYTKLLEAGASIRLSFTIDHTKSILDLKKYVKFLKETFPKENFYRLSLMFPKGNQSVKIRKNSKIGKAIFKVCKELVKNNITGSFDCVLLPCFFYFWQYSFIKKYFFSKCDCKAGALDIKSSGEVFKCYPCDQIKLNLYDIEVDIAEAFKEKTKEINLPERDSFIHKKCTNCKYYNLYLCSGPCLGLFDITQR